MNFRLWTHLFFFQFVSFSAVVVIIFGILIYELNVMTLAEVFTVEFFNIPVYLIIIAFILTMSIVLAIILTVALSSPFEQIRARINWLLLGKYQNEIFRKELQGGNWFDASRQTAKDINRLRDKIVNLSTDLQEYTAAPVFVGEDTKEEIIDKERNRIARELHDSVSQQLFAATMMISAISEVAEREELSVTKSVKKVE